MAGAGQPSGCGGIVVAFLGTAAFIGAGGESRYVQAAFQRRVEYDIDGDGVADGAVVVLVAGTSVTAFIL